MNTFVTVDEIAASVLAGAPPYLLLFDYDGTLADFGPNPRAITLPPTRRALLAALAGSPEVSVGIVSGRRLDDLRARVDLNELFYAGLHGLEIASPSRRWEHPAASANGLLRELAREMAEDVAELPGVFVEDKGKSFVVHWRQAGDMERDAAESALARLLEPVLHQGRIRLQRGNAVCEVLPNVPWNKGDAVIWIRREVAQRAGGTPTTLFVGDDLTDEDAFAALGATGITVVVGERRSRARFRIESPQQVEDLLARLVAIRERVQVG